MDALQHERQDGKGVLETDRSGGGEDGSMGAAGSGGATAGGFSALLAGAAGGAVGTGPVGWPPGVTLGGVRGGGAWAGTQPGWLAPTPSVGAWPGGGFWQGPAPAGGAWPGSTLGALPRAAVGGGPWPAAPAGGVATPSGGEETSLRPSFSGPYSGVSTAVRGSGIWDWPDFYAQAAATFRPDWRTTEDPRGVREEIGGTSQARGASARRRGGTSSRAQRPPIPVAHGSDTVDLTNSRYTPASCSSSRIPFVQIIYACLVW